MSSARGGKSKGCSYMRKAMFAACIATIIPSISFAGERTLFAVAEKMLTVAEATMDCAGYPDACTEADAVLLRDEAVNGLQDLVNLVTAGDMRSLTLTTKQVQYLAMRLAVFKERFVHVSALETLCNAGFVLLEGAVTIMRLGGIFHLPLVLVVLLIFAGSIVAFAACFVLLSCLFWWL